MCGGAIINDFIPQRNPSRKSNRSFSAAADLWPAAAASVYSNSHHVDSDSESLSFPREKGLTFYLILASSKLKTFLKELPMLSANVKFRS